MNDKKMWNNKNPIKSDKYRNKSSDKKSFYFFLWMSRNVYSYEIIIPLKVKYEKKYRKNSVKNKFRFNFLNENILSLTHYCLKFYYNLYLSVFVCFILLSLCLNFRRIILFSISYLIRKGTLLLKKRYKNG